MRRPRPRDLSRALFPGLVDSNLHDSEQLSTITAQFMSGDGRVGHYEPGQLLQVEGKSMIEDTTSGTADIARMDRLTVCVCCPRATLLSRSTRN